MRIHPGLSLVTAFALAGVCETLWPMSWNVHWYVRATGASLLFAIAVVMLFRAIHVLQRARTTAEPFKEPSALVTEGPFRVSRNPMYLANVLLLVAFACLAFSVWFLFAAAAQFLLLHSLVIPREEVRLRGAFPEATAAWFSKTRRWL